MRIAIVLFVALAAGFILLAGVALAPGLFGPLTLLCAQILIAASVGGHGIAAARFGFLAAIGIEPRGRHGAIAAWSAAVFLATLIFITSGGEARAGDCGPPGRVVAKLLADGLSQRVSAAAPGRTLAIFEDRAGRWVALDWRDGRACITDRGPGPVAVVIRRGEPV